MFKKINRKQLLYGHKVKYIFLKQRKMYENNIVYWHNINSYTMKNIKELRKFILFKK